MNYATLPPTIRGLKASIDTGQLSASEAVRAQLERLQVEGARYRCVVRANNDALAAPGGLLSGVGLAHKDIFYSDGQAPGCGHPDQKQAEPSLRSAAVLQSLKQSGAANLAALAMAEFACGATGQSRLLQPINPLDADLAVGGSSSGSAVAVAAGLCYASLGTDTAGSVRIPAATCGLLGLKTTHGALSAEGVFPLAPSLDTVGILARSAIDAALVLAGLDEKEQRMACAIRIVHRLSDAAPAQVAVAIPFDDLQEDVALALEEFGLGLDAHKPRFTTLPALDAMTRSAQLLLHVEAAQVHWERMRTAPDTLSAPTLAVLEPGAAIPALWYLEALARRAEYRQRVLSECFAGADIVLLPALPEALPDWAQVHTESPTFEARRLLALHQWMPFVNYLGLPSIVFPVGRDARNRPVCVQAIARPFQEQTLLAFAYRHERERYGANGFLVPGPATPFGAPVLQ